MMWPGRSSLIQLASFFGLAISQTLSAEPKSGSSDSATAQPASTVRTPPRLAEHKEPRVLHAARTRTQVSGRATKGAEIAAPATATATLPGFRMLDGGASQVYVELSGPVEVAPQPPATTLVFTLKGARVSCGNNRNPLLTTHFATPVARIQLVPRRADLDLIIELRVPVSAVHRVAPIPESGGVRFEVDFPSITPTTELPPHTAPTLRPVTPSGPPGHESRRPGDDALASPEPPET